MNKIFNLTGELNLECFGEDLRQQTDNLNTLLMAAAETHCSFLESTHLLIALSRIQDGVTQGLFASKDVRPNQLQKGLISCLKTVAGGPSPRRLTRSVLDQSAQDVFQELEELLKASSESRVTECRLLLATLKHLTPVVIENLAEIGLTPGELIRELADCAEIRPLDCLDVHAYSMDGQRVVHLMITEAESLGYEQVDPRHLLMGLLELEGGATQTGILQQNLIPKKVQEFVMVNLRSRASRKSVRLALRKEALNPQAIAILQEAAQLAITDRCSQIYEVHLLRAFLHITSFALRLLSDAGVNQVTLRASAQAFRPEDEPAVASKMQADSWDEIQGRLSKALVGQDHVVNSCLPYIRRSLFGFKRPGKPAAVFLFCGPSGVGKTEMAKSIARAVYGSDDNLIMIEMGQFQTKESMNIFVGAPPGYVGYGDGKLTNGLRDKPRSVVLFDEVEKAHSEVFDALLRFIDEGRIDDPAGPVRDGSECIIVMTSNVAVKVEGEAQNNRWAVRSKLREALLKVTVDHAGQSAAHEPFRFRPEFLNRIDEIILFRALDTHDMTTIAQRYLEEYQQRLLVEKQIQINYSPNIKSAAWLIGRFCASQGGEGADNEGARPILRLVLARVLDPIIDFTYGTQHSPPYALTVHIMADPREVKEPTSIVGFEVPPSD